MAKVIWVSLDKCIGCRLCEMACSEHHFGEFSRILSGISIEKFDLTGRDVPVVCLQCEKAPCEEVCPVTAIQRDSDTGDLFINYDNCIGCKACVPVCPVGAMNFSSDRGIPVKCDGCLGDPECVKICPTNAIEYIEEEKLIQRKRISLMKTGL